MTDIVSAVGELLSTRLGVEYAGQEPLSKDMIPARGLLLVERIGGRGESRLRSDKPWVQVVALGVTKKGAYELIRSVREIMAEPRVKLPGFFVYGVEESLAVEEATLPSDPFYRFRCTWQIHVNGVA